MIANPEVADVFRIRAKVVKREYALPFFFSSLLSISCISFKIYIVGEK